MMTNNLTEATILDESKSFLSGAPGSITTDLEMNQAVGWMASLRVQIKKWDKFFLDLKKPLKEAIQKLDQKKAAVVGEAQATHDRVDQSIRTYRQAQQAAVAEKQQAENQAYHELAQEASETGQDVSQVPVPSVFTAPAKSLDTGAAKVSFQAIVKARLASDPTATTDSRPDVWRNGNTAIPDDCWMLDWRRVLARAKAGQETPGMIRYTEEVSKVRAGAA